MPTHVALLRGVNVGGRNRVAMADLRRVVESLGHTDVGTVIQSGNVVFTTEERDTAALAAALEEAVADALDVRARAVVRSRAELARTVVDDPFPHEPDPKAVHAVFLFADPGPTADARLAAVEQETAGTRDRVRLVGRTLFLHTPDGFGRSRLAELVTRATAGDLAGTARNRATVHRLLALCDAGAGR